MELHPSLTYNFDVGNFGILIEFKTISHIETNKAENQRMVDQQRDLWGVPFRIDYLLDCCCVFLHFSHFEDFEASMSGRRAKNERLSLRHLIARVVMSLGGSFGF